MTVPDINDPRPAYVQIAEDLRAQIKSGRLPKGAKLPPQRSLAESYGVAGNTLRSALDLLVDDGLISSGSTRGTYVLKEPEEPGPSPEFLEVMDHVKSLTGRVDVLEAEVARLREHQRGS